MSIAAVPAYLGEGFQNASPGMRFGMYFAIWHRGWEKSNGPDWRTVCEMKNERDIVRDIQKRQATHAEAIPDCFTLPAQSIAPFVTGMGNEHPLENGFSFLWPYGLPYLPGSGIKGVLRQAARELISGEWADDTPWRQLPSPAGRGAGGVGLLALDILFGLESEDRQTERFRGVLSFWDVIPNIKGDKLMVEIMTPHQTHYYRDGEQPHDSGQPTPISFLTVPPGSGFTFHVQCDLARLARLAPELARDDDWKTLLESAFGHAFDWLGFGAKTAVGYGAMQKDPDAGKSPLQREAEQWIEDTVKKVKSANNIKADVEAVASKPMAEQWCQIDDEELKQHVLGALKCSWEEKGRVPSKKAARIYEEVQ